MSTERLKLFSWCKNSEFDKTDLQKSITSLCIQNVTFTEGRNLTLRKISRRYKVVDEAFKTNPFHMLMLYFLETVYINRFLDLM